MAIVVGKNRLYLKSIDLEEGKLEFTTNSKEALKYRDTWKPGVELDMLRHNFMDEYGNELKDMTVKEISSSDDEEDYPDEEATPW